MTPEEQQLLNDLANKVAQTPPPPVDREAEEFIRTRIGSRPDALYLMTQTVLIQNMALEHAKQQIQQLQQQASQAPAASSSSFLGSQAPAARPTPTYGSSQQNYSAPPPPPPTYQAVPVAQAPASSGGSSFLRGAAQTAAGVAAGALAFEGISSLFHGFGHGGGFFGGGGVSGYAPPEETIINNYYDSPRDEKRGTDGDDRDDLNQDDSNYQDDSGDYQDDGSDDSGDDSGGDFLG